MMRADLITNTIVGFAVVVSPVQPTKCQFVDGTAVRLTLEPYV